MIEFSPSKYDNNFINFGEFGDTADVVYVDHFRTVPSNYTDVVDNEKVISDVLQQFFSVNLLENPELADIEYEVKNATYEEIKAMGGDLYIKKVGDLNAKPLKMQDALPWLSSIIWGVDFDTVKVISFNVYNDVIILETEDRILFVPYSYDGETISDALGLREALILNKNYPTKTLFNEAERVFYILQLREWEFENNRIIALPHIYKFNPVDYTIKEVIDPFVLSYKSVLENSKIDNKYRKFSDNQNQKNIIIGDGELLRTDLKNGLYQNLFDFEVIEKDDNGFGQIGFSYNSALGTYLISYVVIDWNGTPYLYEHKFRMTSLEDFESSLSTNVYTLKALATNERGELIESYYVYNSELGGGEMTAYPYGSYKSNEIFVNLDDDTYDYNFRQNILDLGITFEINRFKEKYNYSKHWDVGRLIIAFNSEKKYNYPRQIVNVGDFGIKFESFVKPIEPDLPDTPEEPDEPVVPEIEKYAYNKNINVTEFGIAFESFSSFDNNIEIEVVPDEEPDEPEIPDEPEVKKYFYEYSQRVSDYEIGFVSDEFSSDIEIEFTPDEEEPDEPTEPDEPIVPDEPENETYKFELIQNISDFEVQFNVVPFNGDISIETTPDEEEPEIPTDEEYFYSYGMDVTEFGLSFVTETFDSNIEIEVVPDEEDPDEPTEPDEPIVPDEPEDEKYQYFNNKLIETLGVAFDTIPFGGDIEIEVVPDEEEPEIPTVEEYFYDKHYNVTDYGLIFNTIPFDGDIAIETLPDDDEPTDPDEPDVPDTPDEPEQPEPETYVYIFE